MHPNEKWGQGPPCLSRIRNFCTLIKQCGLIYLGYSGPAYTWTNKRFTTRPTFQRLDRCLGNLDWCQIFPQTVVYHLPMLYSDHTPILAILNPNRPKPKRRFRFQNWWLTENDFHETAAQAWAQSKNQPFHNRTKALASNLKKWVKKKKPLNQQLEEIEQHIAQIQENQPDHIDHATEQNLVTLNNQILDKITYYYRQLSKKHWATKGDRNTRFFQQACTKRRQKNRILFIENAGGQPLADPQDIAQEFISYFSNLFTTTVPAHNIDFQFEGTITNEFTNSTQVFMSAYRSSKV